MAAVGGCAVTVSTPAGWQRLRDQHAVDVHVKVETGMGRWGLDPETALRVGEELASGPRPERLAGLMSHLATADEPDRSFVDLQADDVHRLAGPCDRDFNARHKAHAVLAGCGKKETTTGILKSIDSKKKTVTVEQGGKAVTLRLTPQSMIKGAEALVGKKVSVISEHKKVDSVKATREVSPRKRYSVRPMVTSPTLTGARLAI